MLYNWYDIRMMDKKNRKMIWERIKNVLQSKISAEFRNGELRKVLR